MSSHTAEIPIEARSHRRLLASVKVRDQVSHPLRRDSGRSSNRNRHLSPSVNTSRHFGSNLHLYERIDFASD
jgi:hypothetical protein